MNPGARRIRVACRNCGNIAIRKLAAGDDRTLKQLRTSLRCWDCGALASRKLLLVHAVKPWRSPSSENTARRHDQLRPAKSEPTENFWKPAAGRTATCEAVEIAADVGPSAFHFVKFVLVCGALMAGLLGSAGAYGLGGSVYRSVQAALVADPLEAVYARQHDAFCDTRIDWMTRGGPATPEARAHAYNVIAHACPERSSIINQLRITRAG